MIMSYFKSILQIYVMLLVMSNDSFVKSSKQSLLCQCHVDVVTRCYNIAHSNNNLT